MKEIIDVELKVRKVDFIECKTDVLAVGLFSMIKSWTSCAENLTKSSEAVLSD